MTTFPLNFGPDGAGYGSFYRTASGVSVSSLVELRSFWFQCTAKFVMKIRMHFDRLVTWYVRKQLIPVYIEANTYNFYWSKDVISTETNTVNSSRQLGNDCGRALRSYVRRKSWTWIWTRLMMTLNRFKRPVKISKWDTMKTKNHWNQRFPEQE